MGNPDYWKEYAESHLRYEISMLDKTIQFLINEQKKNEGYLKNAVFESFLIHARNLLDFLYPLNSKEDDVTVLNYINTESYKQTIQKLPDDLVRYRIRINKEIAHLTKRRESDESKKEWRFFEIGYLIFSSLGNIIGHFENNKIDPDFRDFVRSTSTSYMVKKFKIQPVYSTTKN
jgi:hypothetical protein